MTTVIVTIKGDGDACHQIVTQNVTPVGPRSYRVDGEDVIGSTDERLFLVDVDDDVSRSRRCNATRSASGVTRDQSL